ncbi:MAG TPA: sugar dehydrogenase complex small subunit [Casimicrobiaceae bacterium]|nr:sugar dehydrogenase complex small subunit [Casimicrobiaceae bacterium]
MHRRGREAIVAVDSLTGRPGRTDATRRRLLGSFVGAYVASLVPFAIARPADDDSAAFSALSGILVGRSSLDTALGKRLRDALAADDPGFAKSTHDLLALIEQRRLDPLTLQSVLDGEKSPLATLPGRIVTAWYMGIVGDPEHARCLAFETALCNVVVADILEPPTYCHGAYASWTRKPT